MSGGRNFTIPVSNGIFEHREKIGAAIWVFLWTIDRTTKEVRSEDGGVYGLVYGGAPIRAREIARDLNLEYRTVLEHLNQLAASGYLRRIESGNGKAAGFAVVKSKKGRKDTPHPLLDHAEKTAGLEPSTLQEKVQGRQMDPAGKTAGTLQEKVQGPCSFSAPHNGMDYTKTLQRLNTSAPSGECDTSSEPSPEVPIPPTESTKTSKPAKVTILPAVVEALYRAYPRHVAAQDARQAILKAIARIVKAEGISQSDAAERLLSRVETYAARVKREGTETRFVPYPATWFNGERYDDDSFQRESPGTVQYTDPASVYESPEYQRAEPRRSA